jgi:HD-like signal output (HDOD) protein
MKSVAISVVAFVLWLALVMVLTILLLKLHQDVETVQSKQIDALKMAEGAELVDVSELEARAVAKHNLFNSIAILLAGALAFGLVVFTIWVYRLASAARDAQDLVEFRGLVSARRRIPPEAREPAEAAAERDADVCVAPPEEAPIATVEARQPDLLEPEPPPERPRPEPPRVPPGRKPEAKPVEKQLTEVEPELEPAAESVPEEPEPEPAPIRSSVTITPAGKLVARPALDRLFEALAPPDKKHREQLDALRRAGLHFPDLGDELGRLLRLVSQPKAFMHQLVREISRHPVLAHKLVRFANTLYYSPPRPVDSLNYALVVLGAEGVRSAALAQAVHDGFDFSRPLQVELWHHSIAVAIAAALVARAVRHDKPDQLYAYGLVHCLGRMVLLQNQPQEYARLADLAREEDVPARDIEREAFGFTSAQAGAVALAFWGMPGRMQGAVMHAHDLDAPGLSAFGREAVVAATILNAADAIAKKRLGVCAIPSDARADLGTHHAVRSLGLDESRLDEISRDLLDVYEEQRTFL